MKEALGQQEEELGRQHYLVSSGRGALATYGAAFAFEAALPSCGINAQ